jgi:hypothetical protein
MQIRPVLIRYRDHSSPGGLEPLNTAVRLPNLACGEPSGTTVGPAGGGSMETTSLDAAEAHASCHGGDGDPCNWDWARHKSGFDRYQKRDTYGEELQRTVHARVTTDFASDFWPKFWMVFNAVLFVLSAVIFFLTFFEKASCCGLDWISKVIDLIREALSWLGLGHEAGLCLVRTVSGSAGLGFSTLLIGQMDCGRRTYLQIIAIFKKHFGDARPLFVGSGHLQFSIGDCGIAVTGGNSEHHFNWSAVEAAKLVEKGSITGSLWVCRANLPSFEFGVRPSQATHLLVHMKRPRTEIQGRKEQRAADKVAKKLKEKAPLDSMDFLVIPEHFFHAPVDGCVWREFLGHFNKRIPVSGWTEE